MQQSLTNSSARPLLKTHKAAIFKHAAKLAETHSSAQNQEVVLNKSTTAIYNLTVVADVLDVHVTQLRTA